MPFPAKTGPDASEPGIRLHQPDDEPEESPLSQAVREIEEQVMAKFAKQWNRAGWLGRLILNYRMKAEVEERFERLRPRLGWLMRQHFSHDPNQVKLHTVGINPQSHQET